MRIAEHIVNPCAISFYHYLSRLIVDRRVLVAVGLGRATLVLAVPSVQACGVARTLVAVNTIRSFWSSRYFLNFGQGIWERSETAAHGGLIELLQT